MHFVPEYAKKLKYFLLISAKKSIDILKKICYINTVNNYFIQFFDPIFRKIFSFSYTRFEELVKVIEKKNIWLFAYS